MFNIFALFQDLALKLGGSHVEAKGDIFALKSLFTDRIMGYDGKGINIQAIKNISLSALSSIKRSALILST